MQKILPVILSGGSGTRLWPVSREASPKPFITLPDGESFLQKTFRRAAALPDVTDILVVTRADLYWRTQDHFKALQLQNTEIEYLLEPFGRNTAGAVGIATEYAKNKYGDDTILLIFSADHLIEDEAEFKRTIASAVELAYKGMLVTFGILPTHPETAYGYIEKGALIPQTLGHAVTRFIEKPDLANAKRFIEDEKFLWNAGIFAFKASIFLSESDRVSPLVSRIAREVLSASDLTTSPFVLHEATFAQLPNISIDNAIMELSDRVAVVPSRFDWKDIGSWNAMADLIESDESGNRTKGEVFMMGTKNSYIHSPHRLTATIGLEDLIIIDTPDALLVANKNNTQEVKKVTEHLKSIGHQGYMYHLTVHRPWGTYTILEEGNGFKIKRITVKPGASLSLQSHEHRSEHWVIVNGIAKIVNGEEEIILNTNEGAFVKAGNKHRLSNPGEEELVMIETQVGGYLGEDDIVRYDDHYGRT